MRPIYLDYAATTPVDEEVALVLSKCLTLTEGRFGNPASSTHTYGYEASSMVEYARLEVADLIAASPQSIVWTSGATESNNLAIKGAFFHSYPTKNHIITSLTEHKAVLDTCDYLELYCGAEVTRLKPGRDGLLSLEQIEAALKPETALISIMHVNNEIGVIQDIAAIGALARKHGVLFHVDAAQSMGKVLIDVEAMRVDLMSLTAHKVYGPKGIGALYVCQNPEVIITPQIHGGGHQSGMRSGTLPTHQIVGMGKACSIAKQKMPQEVALIKKLRDKLWQILKKEIKNVERNGSVEKSVCGILNVSFPGVSGEALLARIKNEIAISTSSACSSSSSRPSHVLSAIGAVHQEDASALRISVGRYTSEDEIDKAAEVIIKAVKELNLTPSLWKL